MNEIALEEHKDLRLRRVSMVGRSPTTLVGRGKTLKNTPIIRCASSAGERLPSPRTYHFTLSRYARELQLLNHRLALKNAGPSAMRPIFLILGTPTSGIWFISKLPAQRSGQ